MSTDFINWLRAIHQFNHWFHHHAVFEMYLFYLIRCLSSWLGKHFVLMDPRSYSWLEKNGFHLRDKCLHHLPPALLKMCNSCKDCSTKICLCQKLLGSCTIYCGCGAKCQNIYSLCPNDSSFESNCLLYAHIPSPGYLEQVSPSFVLK